MGYRKSMGLHKVHLLAEEHLGWDQLVVAQEPGGNNEIVIL
jgi:hypothetical protein